LSTRGRATQQITHARPNTTRHDTTKLSGCSSAPPQHRRCSIDDDMGDGAAAAPTILFRTICVFCGSNAGRRKVFGDAALELGNELVSMCVAGSSALTTLQGLAMPRSTLLFGFLLR
jgi:hypothetical protein